MFNVINSNVKKIVKDKIVVNINNLIIEQMSLISFRSKLDLFYKKVKGFINIIMVPEIHMESAGDFNKGNYKKLHTFPFFVLFKQNKFSFFPMIQFRKLRKCYKESYSIKVIQQLESFVLPK